MLVVVEITEFSWEREYVNKWEIEDDENEKDIIECVFRDLSLIARDSEVFQKLDREERKNRIDYPVQRKIFRSLAVVLDLSYTMNDADLKPSRLEVVVSQLKQFIRDFFYHNSLSSLCIIVSHDRRAFQLTPLSRHMKEHLNALDKLTCSGKFSLQLSLDIAIKTMELAPSQFAKEIICLISSISTCDPRDIYKTISIIQEKVRTSSLLRRSTFNVLS